MKYRYLYRYEDSKGLGPYRDFRIGGGLNNAHSGPKYPSLYHDLEIDYDDSWAEDFYCGMKNHQQVKEWFKGFNKDLKRLRFSIYKYKVTDYILGKSKKQVFFKQEQVIWKRKLK